MLKSKAVDIVALNKELEDKVIAFVKELCEDKTSLEVLFLAETINQKINNEIFKYIDNRDLYL